MKFTLRFIFSLTVVIGLLFNSLVPVFACSDSGGGFIFDFRRHADFPLQNYAAGKIGVVPRSYGRMSLFVFYRELNGMPLTKKEQEMFVSALNRRIDVGGYKTPATDKSTDYIAQWQELRKSVTGTDVKLDTDKMRDYANYANCMQASIETATATLKERIKSYGTNENTKDWLAGQDKVFSNCGEKGQMPDAVSDSAPSWLKKDRAYQIAASKFYTDDFAGSRTDFEAIANDADSGWNKTAKYLIARTYIREASFINADDYADTDEKKIKNDELKKQRNDLFVKAENQLNAVLKDKTSAKFHESAEGLIGVVKYRNRPVERVQELAETLLSKNENPNLESDLTDFIWLLDKSDSLTPAEKAKFAGNNFVDWLFSYQSGDSFNEEAVNENNKQPVNHAFDEWKKSKNVAWFVSAIIKADKSTPFLNDLLIEADNVKPNSVGFATVRFHQVRLLLESGKRAEARKKLDEVKLADYTKSTQNMFTSQKMILAENLADFVKFAQRIPADFVETENEQEVSAKDYPEAVALKNKKMFDTDASDFINTGIPLASMRELAANKTLEDSIAKTLTKATWTRAIVLNNEKIENEMLPLLSNLGKQYEPFVSNYQQSAAGADKEATRLMLILRVPAMRPYIDSSVFEDSDPTAVYSGGWWSLQKTRDVDNNGFAKVTPDFIGKQKAQTATAELEKMTDSGESATYLARRVIAFATQNPQHALTPELLHLAVRATRYASQDNQTLKLSKQAFDILRKNYPTNAWAKKTPYYYGIKPE
jgi:hypothetical protein